MDGRADAGVGEGVGAAVVVNVAVSVGVSGAGGAAGVDERQGSTVTSTFLKLGVRDRGSARPGTRALASG